MLEFDELPTEAAVLDRLASEVNAVPGALVNIRVDGDDVTSALVVAGNRDGLPSASPILWPTPLGGR